MFSGASILTWVGLIAVVVAFVAIMFALRLSLREGASASRWKNKAIAMDQRLGSYDAIMGAYPGLILVWDEGAVSEGSGWGDPKVFGSPAALASIMRFADPGPSNQLPMRILDAIADLNTISERADSLPLRTYIQGALSKQGMHASTRPIILNGERRATHISIFPVNGGVAGIATDADEAEELRKNLSQHVMAHDKLLNSMDEAVVIFGSDKTARFENEAFRHMFGLDDSWSRDRPRASP